MNTIKVKTENEQGESWLLIPTQTYVEVKARLAKLTYAQVWDGIKNADSPFRATVEQDCIFA